MVLPCVELLQYPAYPRPVSPDQDKKVLGYETYPFIMVDNLHVRQPLLACADLVLAFHDENP